MGHGCSLQCEWRGQRRRRGSRRGSRSRSLCRPAARGRYTAAGSRRGALTARGAVQASAGAGQFRVARCPDAAGRRRTSSSIQSPSRTAASGPPASGFGRHVQHHGAVGGAAHAGVGDAHHVADALRAAAWAAGPCCRPRPCPGSPSGRSSSAPSRRSRRCRGRRRRCAPCSRSRVSNTTARPRMAQQGGRGRRGLQHRAARRQVAAQDADAAVGDQRAVAAGGSPRRCSIGAPRTLSPSVACR